MSSVASFNNNYDYRFDFQYAELESPFIFEAGLVSFDGGHVEKQLSSCPPLAPLFPDILLKYIVIFFNFLVPTELFVLLYRSGEPMKCYSVSLGKFSLCSHFNKYYSFLEKKSA